MSEQQLILGRHARFLRGNTHTHTTRSDGQLSPEHTSRWYDENNYDFLVLTDHNIAPWDRRITTVEDDPRLILLGGADGTSSQPAFPPDSTPAPSTRTLEG